MSFYSSGVCVWGFACGWCSWMVAGNAAASARVVQNRPKLRCFRINVATAARCGS